MHLFSTLLSSVVGVTAINLVLSNDDGWAEANIRAFLTSLETSPTISYDIVLAAPADNKSGTGSSDAPPANRTTACEFNTCPAGSGPTGFNASDPRLNWVNSFPATSIRFGIQVVAPQFFYGALPDIAVAGPNVGANLGTTTLISGTVGAAVEASLEGIPSIAFSGTSGSQVSYTDPPQPYESIYASLSERLTSQLIAFGPPPFLPPNIWLNVNYPTVSDTRCNDISLFEFIFTRISNGVNNSTDPDVETCGSTTLPNERDVVGNTTGCFVSVSVGNATNKGDVDAVTQSFVLERLAPLLSCL